MHAHTYDCFVGWHVSQLCMLLLQVAPAMNTFMWDSPFTSEHLTKLEKLGVQCTSPVSKALACGDIGTGAMAAPSDIAAQVHSALNV